MRKRRTRPWLRSRGTKIPKRRWYLHSAASIVVPEWREGKAAYLAGRALGSFDPRYLFLDGAPKPLYGLEYIRGQAEVFVTEGIFDWLTLINWGYPAVCLLGTWLKKVHQVHFDHAQRIYLAFDSDAEGQEATQRLTELWPDRAVALRLPDGLKDVAELGERPGGWEAFAATLGKVKGGD